MSGADELAVFVKVVEEGSFTAAARTLGMPKSSISRNIARLEERLGVRLLNRTTRSLSTTESGAIFYERCVRIVAEIAEAEEALTTRQVTPRGPLTLSAPALISPWLGAVLPDFLRAWPAIQLAHVPEGGDVILASGELEDAARIFPLPGTERVLCASPSLPAVSTPDELRSRPALLLGTQTAGTWLIGGQAVAISGPLAASDAHTLLAAARQGLGIALLPRVVLDSDLERGTLVEVLPGRVGVGGRLSARIHRPYAGARALVDFLLARLRR